MSQVIDTKVVEMQFDNSKFEKNIETSLNSLKFLNKNVEAVGKNRNSLDGLARSGEQVGIAFDNMNAKSKISLNMFDLLAGAGTKAFTRISDAIAGFALNMANSLSGMQAMRDGFNEYELKMGSVQTMLTGAKIIDPKTGKETKDQARRLEIINEELQSLNEYSDKTIYSFKDMTSNIGKFTNNGVKLHDAVQAIQGVANVAAAAGANSGEASRAMYNFSQALSSGSVKLIDWKSIENANMATQDFKQSLLDTALVFGTVVKKGKGYETTTKNLQGKISDVFSKTKGFNDSLAHQWMTTEVLTQTLKNYSTDIRDMSDIQLQEYIDSLRELGYTAKQVDRILENSRKAFEAATEVKTFTQMIDTLKESLGSGWAQTFEIIIGDFMEAKKLFTDLNNTLDSILSPIGDVRNAILTVWKAEGGRNAMIQSFANLYRAVLNLLDPLKKLWKAFSPNTDHSGKALATIFKWLEKITGYIRTASAKVGGFLSAVLAPVVRIGNYISKKLLWLIGKVGSAVNSTIAFLAPAGTAIKKFSTRLFSIFQNKIVAQLEKFEAAFKGFFDGIKKRAKENKALIALGTALTNLKNKLKDLFGKALLNAEPFADKVASYFKRLWDAVNMFASATVGDALRKLYGFLLPRLQKAFEYVVKKLTKFVDFIGSVNLTKTRLYKWVSEFPSKIEAIAKSPKLKSITSTIRKFGSEAFTFLTNKFKEFKTTVDSIGAPTGLLDLFDKIKIFIKTVFGDDAINDKFKETGEALTDAVSNTAGKELTTFQKFLALVTDGFHWLRDAAIDAKDALEKFVRFVVDNTPKALSVLHSFFADDNGQITGDSLRTSISFITTSMSELMTSIGLNKLAEATDGFKNISQAFGSLTEELTNLAKKTSNKMLMSSIKDFAIAVAILAGSVFLLSRVPADKLVAACGAIVTLTIVLQKVFDTLSSGTISKEVIGGRLSLAVLLVGIGISMLAIATSVGVLVAALAAFPAVIKAYNNLGDTFATGMDKVKDVLKEIFDYLNHLVGVKYGFRGAAALIGLVVSLNMLQKTIIAYANEDTSSAMTDGLSRIKDVLAILGDFLSSTALASFNGINIGINFNTLGIAAMILSLGILMKKLEGPLTTFSKMTSTQYDTAFDALRDILLAIGLFIAGTGFVSYFSDTSLTQWLGISAGITMLAAAISSIVGSVSVIAGLANDNPEGLKTALGALRGIFIELIALLATTGMTQPTKFVVPLFGLTVAIGMLTACVVALTPLANSKPWALMEAVLALGVLMISLGATLSLIGQASDKVSVGDIGKLIAVTLAVSFLANTLRRLANTGNNEGLVAAGLAISGSVLAIAGSMRLMAKATIPPQVLVGLLLLAAALWAVAFAIKWFKGASGQVADGVQVVQDGVKQTKDAMVDGVDSMGADMSAYTGPIFKDFVKTIGDSIKEALGDFDLSESIRNTIEVIKEDAKNWAQDFIDIGTNLIAGIATALKNPDNIKKIKDAVKDLGEALLDAFKSFFGISSPSTVMSEQGGFILDGLVQGLMEFPSKLADWVKGIGQYIMDGIGGFFGGVVEKGKALIEGVGEGIQNGKEFIVKKASAIGNAALDKVGKAKEWAKSAAKSTYLFGNKLQNSKNPIKKAAGTMIVGAVKTVGGMAKTFKSAASGAASTFSSQIKSGTNPAKAAGMALVKGAKIAFHDISSAFRTFGKNAAEGFRNGISNMVSSVAAKAREMVRTAKQAAKDEQNSSSPSKDFMEFGNWAAQGYAIGLVNQKAARLIEANARRMVDTAKNAASSGAFATGSLYMNSDPAMRSLAFAMSQISDTLDDSINTSPRIRPVIDMSNVNRNASAISALFGDKGISASIDAANLARNDFENYRNNDNQMSSSIRKLTSQLGLMTDTMNSRSLNNYITIDGASDPSGFADELIRGFRLNARTL